MVSSETRETLERYGEQALSDKELLSLSTGISVEKASKIIEFYEGSLSKLQNFGGLCPVNLTPSEKSRMRAYAELIRRTFERRAMDTREKLNTASAVYEYFGKLISEKEEEHFLILSLDSSLRCIAVKDISKGTVNRALVDVRNVALAALEKQAVSIICMHNHPSGDPSPSECDISLTENLRKGMETINIPLNDHIICGCNSYFSFQEAGMLSHRRN